MLKDRSSSLIGKIPEMLLSGNFTAFLDIITTTPKSLSSSRGAKSYDIGGGVGLGIVAALDICGHEDGVICATSTSPKPRTNPIFVNYGKNYSRNGESCYDELKMDSFADCIPRDDESLEANFDRKNSGIFSVSSVKYHEDTCMDFSVMSDFLSSCHLCKIWLHGKDIYMYRGEKAFCSTECRARQIMIDDDEQRRSVDVSSCLPYTDQSNMFSTGILVI